MNFQALEFIAARFEVFDQRDQRLRRMRGMQYIAAIEGAAIGYRVELAQCAVLFRLRQANFDAGGARGAFFQLTRRAQGHDFPKINDGYSIAQALGFLDVMRSQQDGFVLLT